MLRILICDDSEVFASQLKAAVEASMKKRGLKVKIHEFHSAEEIGTEILATSDIAFLDIDFKGKNYYIKEKGENKNEKRKQHL